MQPFDQAWQLLKADKRTQMFLPYSQHRGRMNLSEPEMKVRHLGTVNPAVQGAAYRQMLRNMGISEQAIGETRPSMEQLASAMGEMDLRGMDSSLHGGDHTIDADGSMYHNREPVSGHMADFTGPGSMRLAGMLGGRRFTPGNEIRVYNTASTNELPVETLPPDVRLPSPQSRPQPAPSMYGGNVMDLM